MRKEIIAVDVDGVLTLEDLHGNYTEVTPNWKNIQLINKLHQDGYFILIYTARCTHGKYLLNFTKEQLRRWNVQYDAIDCSKPYYDYIIDDKSYKSVEEFVNAQKK